MVLCCICSCSIIYRSRAKILTAHKFFIFSLAVDKNSKLQNFRRCLPNDERPGCNADSDCDPLRICRLSGKYKQCVESAPTGKLLCKLNFANCYTQSILKISVQQNREPVVVVHWCVAPLYRFSHHGSSPQ